jgi:hypothetical protein
MDRTVTKDEGGRMTFKCKDEGGRMKDDLKACMRESVRNLFPGDR